MTFQQVKASLEQKVVTEVKRWLDPHYRDKNITKEEYKEIVAKCVSKVSLTFLCVMLCWEFNGANGDV